MNYLSVIIITAAITAVGITIAFAIHQRRLGHHRGLSREEFTGAFTTAGVPAEIAGAVYDYYKAQVISRRFSVSPDDDYEQVLSKGDEDIDDDAQFLITNLGLRMPPNYVAVRSETRIRSLRDMVLWLHWVQQHQLG